MPGQFDPTQTLQSPGVALNASSGNVAAALASATLAAFGQSANLGSASRTTYITGFELTGGGATAASIITGTITGLMGGTISFNVAIPVGATVGITPLVVEFPTPLPASAQATSIVVSFPSFGAGNTNACLNVHGFQL